MNNDIKEILKVLEIKSKRYNHHLKYGVSYENTDEDYQAHLLLDYITNLQEENERLKQYIDFYEDLTKQQINMINDYKSRNKKAFEYIKNNCYYLVDNDDTNLINILKGSDE